MNNILKILLFLFLPVMIFAGASTEDIISVINPDKKYIASIIDEEAKSQNVNVDLIIAIFLRESQFENLNPNYSNAGIGNANAMLNNGKNKVEVKVTQTTWNQGIHYVYDVSEKVKIIKKLRENDINSLTDYDLKLLKNGIDNFENSDNNWVNALTYLNEFDKKEVSNTFVDNTVVTSTTINREDIKKSVTTLIAGLLAIYYMKPLKRREEYIDFYQI